MRSGAMGGQIAGAGVRDPKAPFAAFHFRHREPGLLQVGQRQDDTLQIMGREHLRRAHSGAVEIDLRVCVNPPMALSATVYVFTVRLADADRGVYETLTLRMARHPSESAEYLVTRLLAYCLEYTEGIAFSKGLSDPDEPAIAVRDLTGTLTAWIEVGAPDAARLHRASKAARRVAVYTHKEPRIFLRAYEGERIHKAESLELYAMDRELLAEFVQRLDRRVKFAMTVTDHQLFLDFGGDSVSGSVERLTLG